jgi:hypothetical protein
VIGPYPEDVGVQRVQIRLVTANVSDAGHSDSLLVSLNQNNFTWINYAGDDFERNDDDTYDLLLDGVDQFNDIKWITISKTGDNGWCVEQLELIVNTADAPVYSRSFSPCLWLDNDGSNKRSLTIPFGTLRILALWRNYDPPPIADQLVIEREELESRIEAAVGHALHGTQGYWGQIHGRPVEVERAGNQTVHVDVDLAADVFGPDPEVDLDFDLELSCTDGVIEMRIENLDPSVDFPWYVEFLFFLEDDIEDGILDAIDPDDLLQEIETDECPAILVGGDGAIVFIPPL